MVSPSGEGLLRQLLHRGRQPQRRSRRRRELQRPAASPTPWTRRSGASRPTPAASSPAPGATPRTRPRPSSSPPTPSGTASTTIPALGSRAADNQIEAGNWTCQGDLPDGIGQPAVRRELLRPGRRGLVGPLRPGRVRLQRHRPGHRERVDRPRRSRRRSPRPRSRAARRSRSSTWASTASTARGGTTSSSTPRPASPSPDRLSASTARPLSVTDGTAYDSGQRGPGRSQRQRPQA